MDYYKHFFEMINKYPEWEPMLIYSGICKGLGSNKWGTHEQLMDVTKAYEDHSKGVKYYESITTAV
ncbi:hypothetical protein [Aquibacillus rhizosphaerae]|uniref:Uncharacterized protein n=1 Tax=Aquibacillus rhizosphaerae TaxID=3051431 RepID=A0ABT7LAA9_9BACI|nr:hypothetical protein [Aquibacillus sp. LR5S19]MDL4842805.1 hypothetical protein [Aquibacillus sp. LR5S19]